MRYKIFFLTLIFLFASGCVAHFPTADVLVVPERPVVRVVYHPPPVVRVHRHYPRPVVRTVHRHHRRTVVRDRHRGRTHRHHRRCRHHRRGHR